jgi:WD40 repeat protein
VWNVQTGKEIAPLNNDVMPLSNLSVARRAEKLAVVVKGDKAHCRLWDLRTGKEEPGFALDNGPVKYGPEEILLSDDGKLLLAYHVNSHISVWDVAKKVERHQFKRSFEDGPFRWAFSTDGKFLITSHAGGTIRTRDMADGKKVAELHGHPSGIVALACSPDGAGLLSTCTSCTILRWGKTAWQGK